MHMRTVTYACMQSPSILSCWPVTFSRHCHVTRMMGANSARIIWCLLVRRLLTCVSLFHVINCDRTQPSKLRSTSDQYYAWFVPIVPSIFLIASQPRKIAAHIHHQCATQWTWCRVSEFASTVMARHTAGWRWLMVIEWGSNSSGIMASSNVKRGRWQAFVVISLFSYNNRISLLSCFHCHEISWARWWVVPWFSETPQSLSGVQTEYFKITDTHLKGLTFWNNTNSQTVPSFLD